MTKQLDVILAVKALVAAALPAADLRGFDKDTSKPTRIGPGGVVIGHPGEPGDPEIDLCPPRYNYEHRLFLEVAAPDGAGGETLDGMLRAIGDGINADRTLGGLCNYLSAQAADRNDRTTDLLATTNWAVVPIVAQYETSDPLA
jgi:hypothetical protein